MKIKHLTCAIEIWKNATFNPKRSDTTGMFRMRCCQNLVDFFKKNTNRFWASFVPKSIFEHQDAHCKDHHCEIRVSIQIKHFNTGLYVDKLPPLLKRSAGEKVENVFLEYHQHCLNMVHIWRIWFFQKSAYIVVSKFCLHNIQIEKLIF